MWCREFSFLHLDRFSVFSVFTTLPHFLKVVPLVQCGPSASSRRAGANKTMCVCMPEVEERFTGTEICLAFLFLYLYVVFPMSPCTLEFGMLL